MAPQSVMTAAEAMIAEVNNHALQSLRASCLSVYQSDFDVRRKLRLLLDQAKRRVATK
jgi:hypothetical protein